MSIFGFGKKANVPAAQTSVLNGVRVNQAGYGTYIPVGIGVNRVSQSLVGLWDFLRTTHTTPGQSVGKGVGGGSSTPATTSYTYSTAYQALLCFGYVDHIDAVWTSGGKVPVQQISTNFTVPGGGGHIDITHPGITGDRGVGYVTAYSATVNDFGSASSRTLSGSYLVAGKSGTTTSAGVYVVTTPSPGVTRYTFGSADAGNTVSINYTTTFTTITETAEIVIPGSATYSVPSPSTFIGNSTVNYSASGAAFFGPGDHLVAQHYSADLSGNFTFNSADIGQAVIITWQSTDPNVDPAATTMNWSLINGSASQSPWSYLSGRHQDAALSHPNIALVQSSDLELGQSGSMPQLSFETFSPQYAAGAGIADCNPADVITAILTDPVWGVGLDPSLLGDWSNARAFWQASGFFISVLQSTRTTAWDLIDQILEAGQGVRFWDSGKLQIAVYGDTSVAGNGAIFQPDTQPLVEFDLSDILAQGGSAPVKVETEPENNVFNRVSVAFLNRQNDYNTETIMEDDPGSIQKYGLNVEDPQSWDFIRTAAVAQIAANLRLKRMGTIRDQYTMSVTTRYRSLLVPMKLITVTWADMGWSQKPLRILSIEDSHSGLALTLEEFPYGVSKPTLYPKMTPQAINANPGLINPGDTDIVALEIPDLMNGFTGRTVRIYASPKTPHNWGGCELYTSDDNSFFIPRGQITAPVVFGTLTSTLNVGTGDPDTQTVTMSVADGLQIAQPPVSDFDNNLSLMAIISGGAVEIVAFKNASLTGVNVYTIGTFHRGLFGTTRASHAAGATVVEMGESFVEYTYPASRDGSDLYVKAASFNTMQARLQDLGDLTSSSIVLTGDFPGFYDKALGTLSMGKTVDDNGSARFAGSTAGGNTDGFQVLTNPEFFSGLSGSLSGYSVYDNNSTGHVVLSTVADAACGNTSGFKLQVAVSAGGESPFLGGFLLGIPVDSGAFQTNTYHKGSAYLWRLRANIPVGHNLGFATNDIGSAGGATLQWLSPKPTAASYSGNNFNPTQPGTGSWQEYVLKMTIGTSGTFNPTGFFFIDGSASSPFNWYVSRCSLVNMDAPATISVNYHPRVQYLDPNTGQSPSSTMLNPQLSLLPGQSVAFTFLTETTSTLGFSWGSQSLGLPDGSSLSLGSGSQSFTSLSSSTTYYFVAYLTASGGTATMHFLGPFAGSVTSAQVQPAADDGRYFLGTIHDTTTSSGSGGGGGVDPGGCAHEDCMCWLKRGSLEAEPARMRVGDARQGDFIKGLDIATGEDVYREVKHHRHIPGTMWFRVKGYLCTALDLVYENGAWVPAYKAAGAEKVRGLFANRAEITLDPELPMEDRNYWLDDGVNEPLLMHNPVLPRS